MSRALRTAVGVVVLAVALTGLRGDAQQAKAPPDQPPAPDAAAPGQPPAGSQPVFRTGINFVRVDVIVSDKTGQVVTDLKPADFVVTEDGKKQQIETFKLIKLGGGAVPGPDGLPKPIRTDSDEETEAARDDVRLFAIFLDDYHVLPGSSMAVRAPLIRFIQTQLGPSDMIGVMYPLEPLSEVRMTRDHEAVEQAISKFLGRKFNYQPQNEFEERYANYPTATVEKIRNEVSLSALKALVTHMGSLKEGRKAVILVSEGFTALLPPQMRDPNAGLPGLDNPQANNPFAGLNDPYEDALQFFAGADLSSELRLVYDAANRNNTAIYSVDPRGLAGSAFGIDQNVNLQTDREFLRDSLDTLRTLSEQTDGRAILNSNDIAAGMKQIVRDSSAYYLIGYNSTETRSDGQFHEIKVHVDRPGVQVRARKGYWALNPEEATKALAPAAPGPAPAVTAALAPVETPDRARVVRTWIGTSRGDEGKTRITFVWEPVATAPGDRGRPGDTPAQVSLLAVGADGAPYFRGRVPDPGAAADSPAGTSGPAAAAGAAPPHVTFDAPPGRMTLKVSVEGAASQVLDSEMRDVSVPDLTSPQVSLGTPAVLRAHNAHEYQQLKNDPDAVPVASREFRRTERLLIRVPAYGPAGVPDLTAKLLNRDGKPMADLPVAASGSGEPQIDLPLAGFAPGEYIVQITAGGSEGAKQLVGFRVTG